MPVVPPRTRGAHTHQDVTPKRSDGSQDGAANWRAGEKRSFRGFSPGPPANWQLCALRSLSPLRGLVRYALRVRCRSGNYASRTADVRLKRRKGAILADGIMFKALGLGRNGAEGPKRGLPTPESAPADVVAEFPRGRPDGNRHEPVATARWISTEDAGRVLDPWRPGHFLLGREG